MINVFIYDPKARLLSFPTSFFTMGGKQSVTEPILVMGRDEGPFYFIPADQLSYASMFNTNSIQLGITDEVIKETKRGSFIGFVINRNGANVAFQLDKETAEKYLVTYRLVPLSRYEDIFVTTKSCEEAEVEAAKAVIEWLRYRRKRVNNKSILKTLGDVYGENMVVSYRTINVDKYTKAAKALADKRNK